MSDLPGASAPEQLQLLKHVTGHLAQLAQPQIDQLRVWGLILRSPTYEVQVQVENRVVRYVLKSDAPQDVNLLGGLERSIEWLLGRTWRVEVRAPGWRWPSGRTRGRRRSRG